jgi:hypothetical protein
MTSRNLELRVETVRRFAYALRGAVVDKRLEEEHDLRFYFDADVTLRIVNGASQFDEDRNPDRDPRHLMVRALLACGYAGVLYILRPHAVEIYDALRSRPSPGGLSVDGDSFKDFLTREGVIGFFRDLSDRISAAASEQEKLEVFFKEIGGAPPAVFPMVEMAHGNWEQRLSRFARRGIIRFDDQMEISHLLRDPVVWDIRELIGRERRPRRDGTQLSFSTLRDATALGMLHGQVERLDAGEPVPVVRFYTETDVLREAWRTRDSSLRAMLTYRRRLCEESEFDFIVRDTDYFILRSLFHALRFRSLRSPQRGRPQRDAMFGTLASLSEELFALVVEGGSRLDEFLATRRFRGSRKIPLEKYIAQFESLNFIRTFLQRYEPSEQLRGAVAGLPEVWDFAGRSATREKFVGESGLMLKQLSSVTQSYRAALTYLQRILVASEQWMRTKIRPYQLPDPIRDLGLIRWGIELSARDLDNFDSLIREIVSGEEDEWWRGCAHLAESMSNPDFVNVANFATGCGVLWALNMFDLILETLDRGGATMPVSLKLLRAAAELHGSKKPDVERKAALLAEAEAMVDEAIERQKYLIGLGYLYFHAFKSEGDKFRMTADTGALNVNVNGWRRRAFEVGQEAVGLLAGTGGLRWAFAVNHCVYVADAVGLRDPAVADYLQTLADIEFAHKEFWNYRFADTIGFHHLILADEALRSTLDAHFKQVAPYILREIESAERYFDKIGAVFGDTEIDSHRESLARARATFHSKERAAEAGNMRGGPSDTV